MPHERKAASFWWGEEDDRGCQLDTGVVPWMRRREWRDERLLLTPLVAGSMAPATNLIAKS